MWLQMYIKRFEEEIEAIGKPMKDAIHRAKIGEGGSSFFLKKISAYIV